MATVTFTRNLRRHVECPSEIVSGGNLYEAMETYFSRHPRVRGYVLDDQGAVRHHMVIFVNASQIRDRRRLSDPIDPDAEIYVMQALSGGSV